MIRKKKLILSCILWIVSIGVYASDFSAVNDDGVEIYYNILSSTDRTCEVASGGSIYTGSVSIPPSVMHEGIIYAVTSIGESAFFRCSSVTSVTIPFSVTNIGGLAFFGCSSVTSMTIPSSVTSIEGFAFAECHSLASIEIPNSVIRIEKSAFTGCSSLTSITIPEGVTSIGEYAFSGCSSLTSITIPEGVTSIGRWAFDGCNNLMSVTIPSSVTIIGNSAFSGCGLTSIIVEEENMVYDSRDNCNAIIETNANTLIVGCVATTIPSDVTSIGEYAFSGCSGLKSVTIPSSVTSIESRAFYACGGLTSVMMNGRTPCSLSGSNQFPASNGGFKIYVLCGCGEAYKNAEGWKAYSNYITEIMDVFSGEDGNITWTLITGTGLLTLIGDGHMNNYSNSSNVTTAPWGAYSSIITTIDVQSGVTSIGENAFSGCSSLTSITIPEGVTSIGENAFSGCSSLTSVTIPSSVTSIGYYAFSGCSLTSIIVEGGNTVYDSRDNCNAIIKTRTNTLIVGCMTTAIPSSVTTIGERAFYDCIALTSIVIPSNVTKIGDRAFFRCSGLTSVTIPFGVMSIGVNAFYGCSALTSVTIPSSASIGSAAFSGCSRLTSVTMKGKTPCDLFGYSHFPVSNNGYKIYVPHGCVDAYKSAKGWSDYADYIVESTDIDDEIIAGVDGGITWELNTASRLLTLSGNGWMKDYSYIVKNIDGTEVIVTSAPWGAYHSIIKEVNVKEGVQSIGAMAFIGCSSLTSVTIPSSVIYILDHAFYECNRLTSVTMKGRIPCNLYQGVFEFNSGLKIYVLPGCGDTYKSTEGWSDYAHYIAESDIDEIITGVDGTITWELNTVSRLLTLSGNGKINDYGVQVIGKEVTSAPWGTYDALIKEVDIKEGVTSIGAMAFLGCSSLASVTIPEGVTSIGRVAFAECSSLTSVAMKGNTPCSLLGYSHFPVSNSGFKIYVPHGCADAYKSAKGWSDYAEYIVESSDIDDEIITGIDGNITWKLNTASGLLTLSGNGTMNNKYGVTFYDGNMVTTAPWGPYYALIKEIDIKEGVTSIGRWAFDGCNNLMSVTIPSSVTSIEEAAFYDCASLTSVTIPSSVVSIAGSVFSGCSLTSIIVEGGNTVYDSRDNCNAIIETRTNTLILGCPSTTIPSNVTSIGNSAFSNCNNLTSVTIPEGVTSIGEDAFLYCYDLTSVTIPSSVTSIGDWAFYGCYGLTSVTVFWTRPLTISDETFDGCYDATLLVPVTCISRYANATEWQKFHTMSGYNTFDENEWEALVALHAELQAMGATLDWNMLEGVGSLSMYEELEIDEDHIIGMDLSAIGIAGLFPATLASFSKLESLDLSENHLSGNLSTVLTELKSQNDEAFQALKTFDISHNRYEGNLGVVGECLPTLTSLQASYNQFSDLTPALPSSVNKIDISHQMMDNVVELNLSHLSYGEVMAMIPTILLYDPTSRSYTNGIDLLCTKANLATYDKNTSTDWAMQLRFAYGQWSIPYVSSQNAYYGASGDTLNVLHLTDGSSFKIALSFDSGDANFLDGVDATDLQATILYAFGAYGTHPFNFTAANTYPDDLINVQDVIRTVDILLTTASDESAQNSVKMSHGKSAMDELAEEETEAYVYLYKGKLCLRSSVPVASLSIQAKGNVTWNLTRFGMQQSTAGGNVVGYSLVGATIPANEDVILGEYGEVEIRSVSLSDSDAQPISVSVKGKEATSVSDILDGDLDKTDIYDMSGIKRNTLQEGVNIVKRNGSTIKIYNK